MLRYIGVSWNPHDAAQVSAKKLVFERFAEAASSWKQVLTADGLCVLCAGKRTGSRGVYALACNTGVVLGTLFRSDGAHVAREAPAQLNCTESSAIVRSAAKRLVSNYWGHYVAFLRDAATGERWLLRDPTGMVLCFR